VIRRTALAALLALPVLGLAAGPVLAADPVPDPADGRIPVTVTVPDLGEGTVTLDDAVLRWSLNAETGAAAYFGGCNFLMAGVPGATGDTGGGRVWTAGDGLSRAAPGWVGIARPLADGSLAPATWDTRCQAPDGTTVSTANGLTTGAQVVLSDGQGTVDPGTGTARVEWTGTFTVVFYGGLTYWWASDPVLTVAADGSARLTASAGGYGTSMQDMSQWVPIPETEIVLADLADVDGVAAAGSDGMVATPRYRGVQVQVPAGSSAQVLDGASAGSFPQSFVTFQGLTGQAAYWYSSGGLADSRKVASDLAVSWSASSQVVPRTPTTVARAETGGVVPASSVLGTGGRSAGGALPAGSEVLAALPTVPTAQVRTVGLAGADLVPGAVAGTSADERVAWGTSGLLLAATGAVIGFRRGWLVLPWR
jgi:hypothetical protein